MSTGIAVKKVCPLGSDCEKVVGAELHRCAWYVQLAGKNPQSEEVVNEWRCAMAWGPTMMVEVAQTNRGQTTALESFRNEMVVGQQQFNAIMGSVMVRKRVTQDVD